MTIKIIGKFLRVLGFIKLACFIFKVKSQKRDISQVPIIIISYNQLFYLKQLINF